MRVRRERMLKHFNESTYRAIEAENARAAMAAQEKPVVDSAPSADRDDERDPIQMAKAASAALRGDAA